MYFNPSLEKELDELKFVMSSVYLKRGFLSLEESIKEDFQNKAGIFAEKTIVSKQVSDNNIVEKEVTEVSIDPIVENIIVETITLEDRKSQLEDKKAAEVKVIADELGIEEYTNKAAAIEYILKVEYPE